MAESEHKAGNRICVVIPVHNQVDYTIDVLKDLEAQTVPVKVVIVDNASLDGTDGRVALEAEKIELRYIKLKHNLGVAPAWNVGCIAAVEWGCEYIAICNNDLVIPPWIMEGLRLAMEANPEFTVLSPVYSRGELSRYFFGRTETVRRDTHATSIQRNRPQGFCFMFRRSLIDAIEKPQRGYLFEESFGRFWFEDDDFFRRAGKLGRLGVVPSLYIHHFESVTLKHISGWQEEAREAGRRYAEKWK